MPGNRGRAPGFFAGILLAATVFGVAVPAISAPLSGVEAQASPGTKPEMRESCPGLVAGRGWPEGFALAALGADQARLTFVGHATFLLESPAGVRVVTDYNDYVRPSVRPDIVTMNHAHGTHYTDRPDPDIAHVLRGWGGDGHPARHDLSVKDVRVRNVPTNIRDWGGGTERHGNSIFVFEVANLCIAHLGHLHHTLTQAQLDELGRIDVVLMPVDGSYTLDIEGMIEVLKALKAPLMIPMHYFSSYTLSRFLERVRGSFETEVSPTPSILLSKSTLPTTPKVLVLPGG